MIDFSKFHPRDAPEKKTELEKVEKTTNLVTANPQEPIIIAKTRDVV